jgi:hypothetical protein
MLHNRTRFRVNQTRAPDVSPARISAQRKEPMPNDNSNRFRNDDEELVYYDVTIFRQVSDDRKQPVTIGRAWRRVSETKLQLLIVYPDGREINAVIESQEEREARRTAAREQRGEGARNIRVRR